MDLLIGACLGPYTIVGHVGAGGMGEVYRARDTRLERDVAIKVLPQHLAQNPTALKRFQREAKALASLSHPNILTIYDIGEHNGVAFVVMELLEGKTLRLRIRESPPSCEQAIEIIKAIAQGLLAAHSQGIIHRDLKPENIFITRDERIKILDLGLAKRFYSNEVEGRSSFETLTMDTEVGTVLGTVPYMSPEQARGENVDPRSDIFSTGIMLYELLTGRLPFEGPNAASIIHKIIYEDCPPPTTLKSDLPKWVDPILQRALAKEKDNRYSSTAELLDELKKHQDSSIASTRPTPLQTVRRVLRPASAIPAVILVLALSVLAVWFFNRQAKVRWAREQALPQIEGMTANSWRDSTDAYKLAEEAEKYIPNDPTLASLFSKISLKVKVTTEPSGAKIYSKKYSSPDSEWKYVGVSPIEELRMPIGIFRWKIEKEGYEPVLAAATTFDVDITKENLAVPYQLKRVLDEKKSAPPGMVRVSGAPTPSGKFDDFYVDRCEVTNQQYKKFVDSGGYRRKEYWKHNFADGETALTWEQAMSRFVDQTGRPGPVEWQAGSYPEGQSDYPVSGISWYEAAAYAEFAGKSLPTETHWALAIGASTPLMTYPQLGGFALFAPFSNFLDKGPVSVGSLPGITAYGAHDMAGNVREWCWNETPKGRLIRGGAWGDNTYMFTALSQAPPLDRSIKNGFRCALYTDPTGIPQVAFEPVTLPEAIDYYREEPVADSVFQVYKEQFSYDKAPLNAQVESKKESPEGWVQEKITFDAAYGGERIVAYLFLPKNIPPPYQTVIYFPGSASVRMETSKEIENYYEFPLFLSFIVSNGRAILYPVYKGTFERRMNLPGRGDPSAGDNSHFFRDYKIQLVKDFKRSVDYLESRSDIASKKLAYYGMSWGAVQGALIPAVEDRLQASILVAGGFMRRPVRPEVSQINYITRVKIPTLMLNGKYDTIHSYETSIKPMFDLLGTPKDQKELKLYETDHIPPRNEFMKETLAWLDRYLGPVNR